MEASTRRRYLEFAVLFVVYGLCLAFFIQYRKFEKHEDSLWNSRIILLTVSSAILMFLFHAAYCRIFCPPLRTKPNYLRDRFSYLPMMAFWAYPLIGKAVSTDWRFSFIIMALIMLALLGISQLIMSKNAIEKRRVTEYVKAFLPFMLLAGCYIWGYPRFEQIIYAKDNTPQYVPINEQKITKWAIGSDANSVIVQYIPLKGKASFLQLYYKAANNYAATDQANNDLSIQEARFEVRDSRGNLLERVVKSATLENDYLQPWQRLRINLSTFQAEDMKLVMRTKNRLPLSERVKTMLRGTPQNKNKDTEVVAYWSEPEIIATRKRSSNPNVILISLDTLRADHLGLYGYARDTSPVLDELGRGNITFANAYAESTWTLPSHWTITSSLYPVQHKIKDYKAKIPHVNFPTVAEVFSTNLYQTAAFTNAGYMSPSYGFHIGFNHFDHSTENLIVFDRAADWITSHAEGPFFVFIHTFEIHNYPLSKPSHSVPYADPDYDGLFQDNFWPILSKLYRQEKLEVTRTDVKHAVNLYDGAIRVTDEKLRSFFEVIEKAGLADNTIIIITSDHGESFSETHNNGNYEAWHHGNIPYEEQCRVPLMMKVPSNILKTQRKTVEERVGLIDLAPTMLDLCGLAIPEVFQGKSLKDMISHSDNIRTDSAYFCEQPNFQIYSIVKNNRKFITYKTTKKSHFLDYSDELYDLASDPNELHNLAGIRTGQENSHLQLIDDYLNLKDTFQSASGKSEPISDELKEELRGLGYLQ